MSTGNVNEVYVEKVHSRKTNTHFKGVIQKMLISSLVLTSVLGTSSAAFAAEPQKMDMSKVQTVAYENGISVETALQQINATVAKLNGYRANGTLSDEHLMTLANQLYQLETAVKGSKESNADVESVLQSVESVVEGLNTDGASKVRVAVGMVRQGMGTYAAPKSNASPTDFPDIKTHWAKDYIDKCVNNPDGIMIFQGDNNGNFNPNGTVSLGQFLTVVTRLAAPDEIKPVENGGHWATPNYQAAVRSGIIHSSDFGSEDKDLEAPLSRADMAYILVNAAKVKGETLTSISGVESLIGDWSSVTMARQDAVKKAYSNGLITGKDGGLFAPNDTMTRGEMATVIARLQNYTNRAQVDTSKIKPSQNPYSNPFKDPSSSSQNASDILKPSANLQTWVEGERHTIPKAGDTVIKADGTQVVLKEVTLSTGYKILGFGQGVDIITGTQTNPNSDYLKKVGDSAWYDDDGSRFIKFDVTGEVYTEMQWLEISKAMRPDKNMVKGAADGETYGDYFVWDSWLQDWCFRVSIN